MRDQGPNAQCMDYHDLSSALQLLGIPKILWSSAMRIIAIYYSLFPITEIRTRDPDHDLDIRKLGL